MAQVAGGSISEAREEAARLVAAEEGVHMLQGHDDPLILAGQATAGIEILRQHSSIVAARQQGSPARSPLDAIFLPVGGGSLLAGVAAAVKQLNPTVKVIGVEPQSVDVLRQSLMSGSRVTIEEPGVDGIWLANPNPDPNPDPNPNPNPNPDPNPDPNPNPNPNQGAAARRGGVPAVRHPRGRRGVRLGRRDPRGHPRWLRRHARTARARRRPYLLAMAAPTDYRLSYYGSAYFSWLCILGASSVEVHRVTGCHAYDYRRDFDRGSQEVGGAAAGAGR